MDEEYFGIDKEFIEKLRECETYEEVVDLVDQVIETEIEISKSNNSYNFIGYDSLSNSFKLLMENPRFFEFGYNTGWNGFINDDIRITFGGSFNLRNGSSNFDGFYYYMDTRDFIYDFCYEYKDFEFEDEFELICFVKLSMDKYFDSFTFTNVVNRQNMFLSVSKDIDRETAGNHKFSDFKGRNNALCTERAAYANNLLSVYGVGVCMALGNVYYDGKDEGHAFNFVDMDDGLSLVDFSISANLYDFIGDRVVEQIPFVYDMGDDKTRLSELTETGDKIYCSSPCHVLYGDTIYSFSTNKARIYNIGNIIHVKKAKQPKILLKNNNEYNNETIIVK